MKIVFLFILFLNYKGYSSVAPWKEAAPKKSLHMEPKEDDFPGHIARGTNQFALEINERATPSTEGSEDTIPTRNHHRRMIYSNSVTALLAICVTSGVTLAIHFSNCKK